MTSLEAYQSINVDVPMNDLMDLLSEDDRQSIPGVVEAPMVNRSASSPIAMATEAPMSHCGTGTAAQMMPVAASARHEEDDVVTIVSSALETPGGRDLVGKILELPPLAPHTNEKQHNRIVSRRRCKIKLQAVRALRGYASGSHVSFPSFTTTHARSPAPTSPQLFCARCT